MNKTRQGFTKDSVIENIRGNFRGSLERMKLKGPQRNKHSFSYLDCLMSGLAVFVLKYPSLLQFEQHRDEEPNLKYNLKTLFKVGEAPCDTQLRERLDQVDYSVVRSAYTSLFARLQRGKVLENFVFYKEYYLGSLDGTGIFSSNQIHCENCCQKEHRDGSVTYYHQLLAASLVHPDQKIVFPFMPEPIQQQDGKEKNDCERNAAKRWVKDFRREHPHLPMIIVADGLSSNGPFIKMLMEHNLRYILVAKEADHKALFDWINVADKKDSPVLIDHHKEGQKVYQYMNNVPLNDTHPDLKVNVIRYWEKDLEGKIKRTWTWVTDLDVDSINVRLLVKGGRARWKIENETFNTLKNQGYNFEHNYGHGNKYLTTVFACLMMLAFFIDQCMFLLNTRVQKCLAKIGTKVVFFQRVRFYFGLMLSECWEDFYEAIIHPPPLYAPSCSQ